LERNLKGWLDTWELYCDMTKFNVPEKLWGCAFWTAVFLFYILSMLAILTKKGTYGQSAAAILVGTIILYVIFSKR